jgi:hypothetical protein
MGQQPSEFVKRWSPIPLFAACNQPKLFQGLFAAVKHRHRHFDSVCGLGHVQHCGKVADIRHDSRWADRDLLSVPDRRPVGQLTSEVGDVLWG